MKWLFIFIQLLPSIGVTIYTINFSNWMKRRGHRAASWGGYIMATLMLGLSSIVLWMHS